MLKEFMSRPIFALVLILALPAMARAQVLADRVPADTTLYVGWQGVNESTPGFAGSNLQGFLNDSNIPRVVEDFIPRVLDRVAREDKDAAEAVEVVRTIIGPMWRHPTAIAFVGVEVDQRSGPRPKLIFLCQAGNEAAALKAKVEDLLKQAGQPPFPVNLIQKGELVALVIGYDQPETAIPAEGGKSLANNPEFQKALAQVGKGAFLTAYIDFEKVMAIADLAAGMGGPDIQKNWNKARDVLGLKGLQRAIVTEGFDGKDWATQAFVAAPAPRSGFVGSLIDGKPFSKGFLGAIPENATIAGGAHFDVGGLVAGIRSGVSSFDPDIAKQIDDGLSQVNQMVGLDIQKDYLESFGDEWAYYVDPSVAGNGIVGLTLVNHLKDAAKGEAAFIKFEDFINKFAAEQLKDEHITLAFRQAQFDGVTVHYLGTPLVTPSWAVHDGNLYFALYPEVVAGAVNQVAHQGKSIEENPEFKALMARLGDHPISSFGYLDIRRRAPENYSSWLVITHAANAGDLFGVPAPLAILPSLEKLMTHLSAAGQISWTDADGVHVRGISPFPGSEIFATDQTAMIYEESMMLGLMMPAVSKARSSAIQAKSASNLRQIGMGAIMYANDHKGKFPDDMGEILQAGALPIDMFINPPGAQPIPAGLTQEQSAQWVRERSDYIWNGAGKNSSAGATVPIAWEKPETAASGIYILFADCHVEFYNTPQAMEIIAKAKLDGK